MLANAPCSRTQLLLATSSHADSRPRSRPTRGGGAAPSLPGEPGVFTARRAAGQPIAPSRILLSHVDGDVLLLSRKLRGGRPGSALPSPSQGGIGFRAHWSKHQGRRRPDGGPPAMPFRQGLLIDDAAPGAVDQTGGGSLTEHAPSPDARIGAGREGMLVGFGEQGFESPAALHCSCGRASVEMKRVIAGTANAHRLGPPGHGTICKADHLASCCKSHAFTNSLALQPHRHRAQWPGGYAGRANIKRQGMLAAHWCFLRDYH